MTLGSEDGTWRLVDLAPQVQSRLYAHYISMDLLKKPRKSKKQSLKTFVQVEKPKTKSP